MLQRVLVLAPQLNHYATPPSSPATANGVVTITLAACEAYCAITLG
jgi:hypothetical protein